jgi:hypothetical protein
MSTRNRNKVSGEQSAAGVWDCLSHRYLWADCLDNVGSSTSHNPIGLHGLLRGIALFYITLLYVKKQPLQTKFPNKGLDSVRGSAVIMSAIPTAVTRAYFIGIQCCGACVQLLVAVRTLAKSQLGMGFPLLLFLVYQIYECDIWGSHGGHYKYCRVLACNAM